MAKNILNLNDYREASPLQDRNEKVILGYKAGQQPGPFNYEVEMQHFDSTFKDLLDYGLMNWRKGRTPTIQSLDELSKGKVEIYLDTKCVTNETPKTLLDNPEKFKLRDFYEDRDDDQQVLKLKLVCLVSQTGGSLELVT